LSSARELLATIRGELAPIEELLRGHRYLEALEAGRAPESSLVAFAGEQHTILTSDRRSFAHLAARFPAPPAGDLFLALAQGEGEAVLRLLSFAAALGLDEGALRAHEPEPGGQAYTAFVAWLAMNGSRADVSLAFLANLAAWGESCARMGRALRREYGIEDDAVSFFDFFAEPPPGFEERALGVAEAGLQAGDSPARARRAARLLQAYELMFWDTLDAGLQR
jgi:thiaminase